MRGGCDCFITPPYVLTNNNNAIMKAYKNILLNTIVPMSVVSVMALSTLDARSGYPEGYYDSLNGKCGVALMRAVKDCVKEHTEINYSSGTWEAFHDTDVRTVNGIDCWWDMYSSNNVPVSSGHSGMNVEHSVANSWWGKTKNAAYKDLVHLNPSNSDANSRKSNYPLAELVSVTWDNGVTFVGRPMPGQGGGADYCFEPHDDYKGDFARVFMYMFTIYNDISWKSSGTNWMYDKSNDLMFKQWAQDLLLRWSAADPVSDKERSRNDGIQLHQHNRNPFIDLPDLAEHIWGSKKDIPFSLDGSGNDDPQQPEDPEDHNVSTEVSYTWLSSKSSELDSDWTIENVQLPSVADYIWSWKEYRGNNYLNASAYISKTDYASKAYAWGPEISMTDVVEATLEYAQAAKFQTTLRTLCGPVVRDTETGEITKLDTPTWPAAGNWTFVSSGPIDLKEFSGKNVQIGFVYESTDTGADTWEINDVSLKLVRRNLSGIENSLGGESDDDSFLVEVWGNNILAPAGARIFDMNGREVAGENLSRGVYVVVKPTFNKSVKVLIK